ncbi:large exoprotein [Microbacterium sp.]|uniref:large exoprotein n=1 Tax=Microbacterium sp. TaxID=51671 RepID=UPI003F992029
MDYYDSGAAAAIIAAAGLVIFLFAVVGYVLTSWFLMKVFEKAGVQGKWRAWVPVYNSMIFLKLGDMSPWLILYAIGASIVLSWIPLLGQIIPIAIGVVMIIAAYRVGQKLQKEGAWVVLYIFLSIVWLGINAFDKSRWNAQIAPAPWAGNAFFADRTVWDGVPVQPSAAPAAGAAPGYGAPQQGGYPQPGQPVQGGYPQQPAPGYQPPAAPSTPPAAPSAPVTPPPAPSTPPAAPSTPPTTPPPAAPPAPPAPPADPNQPPA